MKVKFLKYLLFIICGLLLVLDFCFCKNLKSGSLLENEFGLYALVGFLATFLYIFISKYLLKKFIMRDKKYYE